MAGAPADAIPFRAAESSGWPGGPRAGVALHRAAGLGAGGPGRGPDPFPNQPVITLDTGDFDPVIGRSYREISVISRNEHRSQGQGAPIAYGTSESLLSFVAGEMPKKGLFDGIDTSWTRVPGQAGPANCWRKRSASSTICIPKRPSPRCSKRARRSPVWRANGQQLGASGSWMKSTRRSLCAPGFARRRRRMLPASCPAAPRRFR